MALSIGTDPAPGAAWLEGFLHQSGMLLLHDDRLWQILDQWLTTLSEDGFTRVLPLIRRTFSRFPPNELTQLGARAKQAGPALSVSAAANEDDDNWNEARGLRPLGTLRQLLGIG